VRRLTRIVRDLEGSVEGPAEHADPRIQIDDGVHDGEAMKLFGVVVQRIEGLGGIFDPARILQIIAGQEPVDLVVAPAVIETRLRPPERAAVSRRSKAGIGDARLGLNVEHPAV
jgi:hypothetical protein